MHNSERKSRNSAAYAVESFMKATVINSTRSLIIGNPSFVLMCFWSMLLILIAIANICQRGLCVVCLAREWTFISLLVMSHKQLCVPDGLV